MTDKKYVPDVAKTAQNPHSMLKTQKELKKITDSKEYKDAGYKKQVEMLGGKVYAKGGRTGKQFGGPLGRRPLAQRPLAQPGVAPTRPLGFKSGGRTGFKKGGSTGAATKGFGAEIK